MGWHSLIFSSIFIYVYWKKKMEKISWDIRMKWKAPGPMAKLLLRTKYFLSWTEIAYVVILLQIPGQNNSSCNTWWLLSHTFLLCTLPFSCSSPSLLSLPFPIFPSFLWGYEMRCMVPLQLLCQHEDDSSRETWSLSHWIILGWLGLDFLFGKTW